MVAGARYRWVGIPCVGLNNSLIMVNDSVDAQWITAKKDWLEAKKKYKLQQSQNSKPLPLFMGSKEDQRFENGTYDKDMDAMRCILYLHGGMP